MKMTKTNALIPILLVLLAAVEPATAGTITDVSWISLNGAVTNTIIDGNAPLAFTATGSTANPFLNNANSTVSLGYGDYYAIAFISGAPHAGPGSFSFLLNGTATFTQLITTPAYTPAGVLFASFNLPGGDTVTVTTTGLSADRTSILVDGAGLVPDGFADAFYLFSYKQGNVTATPEPASVGLVAAALGGLFLRLRRR